MPTLGPISCVTIAAPDLQRATDLYQRYLGYQTVESGTIPPPQAESWGRPGLAGRNYALLLPEGQGQTYIRFVESRPARGSAAGGTPAYVPFRHMGWNAAELMVQDTDAVAARLAGSPFPVIGPPADLSFSDQIRAMQVLGPSSESLYLTSFKRKLPEFDTPDAHHFVDRVFIVIVGGPSVAQVNDFYHRHFGVAKAPVIPVVISVVSQAHGLPPDSRHDLAALALLGQSYIEADTMPPGTLPRTSVGDELPPAISMVSFVVERLPDALPWLAPPRTLSPAPYHGRRTAVCVGAAGELIELIEA
jgi:catechol 2,3-dioxygenase-like lactoylglutathione lyase family enzyme